MPPNLTPAIFSQKITEYVLQRTEAVANRFLPAFEIPGFFCGIHGGGRSAASDLIYILKHLHVLGVSNLGGMPITAAISKLLRSVDGPAMETFYSYRIAETLLAFGKFENNPLLAGFSQAQIENIRVATDSTAIYHPETRSLRPHLHNNFWAVLARCEYARLLLGILEDETVFKEAVAQTGKWLFRNPQGFFDDSPGGVGRYDIYSADTHLFAEPIWHLLDQEKLAHNLKQHARLIEKITMENGAAFVYGRSIGALSLCIMMETGAMALERGLASDPSRMLRLIAHTFNTFDGWMEDDLINAHRHGIPEHYRGINRLLQMTFDCLGKLCYAAEKLRKVKPFDADDKSALFPIIDEFIRLDTDNAGIWMFRNNHLSFQFPLVDCNNSDYVPWPRSPGLLENPVGSFLNCGVPRISAGALEYVPCCIPATVEKCESGIVITYDHFKCVTGSPTPPAPFPGKRVARYRIDGDTIHWEEHLLFDESPDALSFCIPETARPLRVHVKSQQPFRQDTVAISGMADWRSVWGELANLHQIHFAPAREIRITFEITPKIRFRNIPEARHEYFDSLFGNMPKEWTVEIKWMQEIGMNLKAMTTDVDILHVSWPEHLFGEPTPKEWEAFDARNLAFIETLGRSNVRIVWTMHNRRPHRWNEERGRKLYEAWARIADGVIHHSKWAMDIMRSELPYRSDAKHIILPHGHFGAQRHPTHTRAEIEALLGLAPCAMRFGITGGWGKAKQIEMILEAFTKAARPDQQLVLTAYAPNTPKPVDPRIVFLPREGWMTPEEIANYTLICDALVSAHQFGGSYITSGMPADAIGAGIPMFAPHWEYYHETLGDAPFYHDNTLDSLAAAFASITPEQIERGKAAFRALQPVYAWPPIVEKTLAFYRSFGRKRQ